MEQEDLVTAGQINSYLSGVAISNTDTSVTSVNAIDYSNNFTTIASDRYIWNAIPTDIIDQYVSDPTWNALLKLFIPHSTSELRYGKVLGIGFYLKDVDPGAKTLLDLFGYKVTDRKFNTTFSAMSLEGDIQTDKQFFIESTLIH